MVKKWQIKELFYFVTKETSAVNSVTTTGAYLNKYNCWSGFLEKSCFIIFYEWSNVNGSKKIFKKYQDFYDFLEASKISFPDYNMRLEMEKHDLIYATCVEGKSQLVIGASKEKLKEAQKKALETKPTTYNTYPYNSQYCKDDYDNRWDGYDDD